MKFSKKLFSLFVFLLAASLVVDVNAMKRPNEDSSNKRRQTEPTQETKIDEGNLQSHAQPINAFELICKQFQTGGCCTNNQVTLTITNSILNNKAKFDSLLQFLQNHPSVKVAEINASHTNITNQQLTTLLDQGNLSNTLQTLNLSLCNQLNWDNIQLGNPQNLITLNICYTFITNQQLTTLLNQGNLRNTLQSLKLSRCNQLNWDNIQLGNPQNLTTLNICHTSITNQQLTTLLNQGNIRNTLQSLNLSGCNQLQQLTLNTQALQSLNLNGCEQLNFNTINLGNPQNLITLDVCGTSVTDQQLTTLLNQGNIRNTLQSLNLELCHTSITDKQLTTLLNQGNLRNTLQSLNLSGCNQLQQLTLRNMKALQTLDLYSCNQLDWDNIQLGNPQNLITLNVSGTSITNQQLTNLLNQGNLRNTLQSLELDHTLQY